ncbi:MAG: selenocysteine-specific translation elongation factor, partial [Armatimonadetes bacterium]|nr:selenocysteine-specific translation elongation factor [Armatimonadota bacterium]
MPSSAPHVIGTAGHIDHGKSALVRALTGIDPDRLEEEKRRGMTIDLGFAHLDLPDGRRVGIVDVPGHERLIRNMLAGAGGMDLILLVVAADEGVMPQTREHLDILRFLRPRGGLIVVSKIDLVEDPEWLALVEEDLRRLTAGTFLEGAEMIRVSAKTGAGLEALVGALGRRLDALPGHPAEVAVRLPIDRVFTMAGFGTVVTGTLWSGRIRIGDTLAVLPDGGTARVRQIERHGERVEEVAAGSRAALNLVGIDRDHLERGAVLATPSTLRAAALLDAQVRLLPGSPPLAHLARLRFYLGTDEALCRLALLDRDRLAPGEEAPVQLRFERPVVAVRGDRFVLRRYSPLVTVGGGVVLGVDPPRRRRGTASAAALAALADASPVALLQAAIGARGLAGTTPDMLAPTLGERPEVLAERVKGMVESGAILQVGERLFDGTAVDAAAHRLLDLLQETHRRSPWRLGLPREEVKSRALAGADDRLAAALLDRLTQTGAVGITRGFVHLSAHRPALAPPEAELREAILQTIAAGGFAPPALAAVETQVVTAAAGVRPGLRQAAFSTMVQSLQDEGKLVEVAPGILFASDVLEEVRRRVVAQIEGAGEITVAALRDALGTSRKYA